MTSGLIRAFVVGHPIGHSRSPLIHGHWLAEHGLKGSYERIDVPPEGLADFLAILGERGFAGGNVTVPHKEAAFGLIGSRSPEAERLGAVNTIVVDPGGGLHGHNTDGAGFVANVDEIVGSTWPAEAGTALVLGAGGAARAIVPALLDRGVGRVLVANRTPGRAEAFAGFDLARVEPTGWDAIPARLAGIGLLVNTTSLGMVGQPPLEVAVDALPRHAVVADIVYVPLRTRLLESARTRGLRTVEGLGMLLHQAVPGFEAWFGVRPTVTPALRALIEADVEGRSR